MIAILLKESFLTHPNFSNAYISPNWDWSFPDAGQLPVPVLAIENVSFNYPGGKELYSKVDFGVDLQTRVALVGPNGGVCAKTCNNFFIVFMHPISHNCSFIHIQLEKPP